MEDENRLMEYEVIIGLEVHAEVMNENPRQVDENPGQVANSLKE